MPSPHIQTATEAKTKAKNDGETREPAQKLDASQADGASTEPQDHPMASILDPFLKQNELHWWSSRNLSAMTEMLSASMHGAMKMTGEATRFMNERLQQDMEMAKNFSACRTGEDAFRTGSAFFDNTIRAYADETAKMMHLAADATASACKPVENRTKEALHSIAAIPKHNGLFV